MENKMLIKYLTLVLHVLTFCLVSLASIEKLSTNKNTYIVHMAKSELPLSFDGHSRWYESVLESVSESNEMLYTYENVAHGFSTRLTYEEAQSMKNQPGVLFVRPDMIYNLHTTRTPHFLGLDKKTPLFPKAKAVGEVIVGMIDTGIWPESKSFNDIGMGPIPSHWKGGCESGTNFTTSNCNRKIIGARSFYKAYEAAGAPIIEPYELKSPRDTDGHGTHTASTVAGSVVLGANLFGYANGTAQGMASQARVAVYKVCWKQGCAGADILAAMDRAITDQVDIMSISLGIAATDYYNDNIAIGAFAAIEKGILVSCSAGNDGPGEQTVSNAAPWIITIGAGTLDRDFPAPVILGDGVSHHGISLYEGTPLPTNKIPVVYGNDASTGGLQLEFCTEGSLSRKKVNGKIVICDRGTTTGVEQGIVVKAAGGVGMIVANTNDDGKELFLEAYQLPATTVGYTSGQAIKHYISSNPNHTATILFQGTKLGIQPAPKVASFSSRGPHLYSPGIIKPDVIAPGDNILASWTGSVAPSEVEADKRRTEFNIISGTSMSCPHLSGIAALLKAARPNWTPAAIRSALITTAYASYGNGQPLQDVATGKPSTPFVQGAGHVNPILALDPGLIYDLQAGDYLDYLCSINYTPENLKMLTRSNFTCDKAKKYNSNDLNYPSFYVAFKNGKQTVMKYSRTLTNVGMPATYKVSVKLQSENVKVAVEPASLSFTKLNEKMSYTVTFSINSAPLKTNIFGRIEWSDGKHIVGSPVAITWN